MTENVAIGIINNTRELRKKWRRMDKDTRRILITEIVNNGHKPIKEYFEKKKKREN